MSDKEYPRYDSPTTFGCVNARIISVKGPKEVGGNKVTTVTTMQCSKKENTTDAYVDFEVWGNQADNVALLQKGDLFTATGVPTLYPKNDGSTGLRVNVNGRVSWAARLNLKERQGGTDEDRPAPTPAKKTTAKRAVPAEFDLEP